MRVFLTGATGFVGSALITELLKNGHEVLALARSEQSENTLLSAGARVHRGDLGDLESLKRGATAADGVIHTAFDHDFSKFAASAEADVRAIQAIGSALAGSDRPFVVTSGLPALVGRVATETDDPAKDAPSPRRSEQTAMNLVEDGVRASIVRMSQVHDRQRQGFATHLIKIARDKRFSAYIDAGENQWATVHRLDTGSLYRLALEAGIPGAKYHAVGKEGVNLRSVAEAIGQRLGLPTKSISADAAATHFGDFARAAAMNVRASSDATRRTLGWNPPERPSFISDIEQT